MKNTRSPVLVLSFDHRGIQVSLIVFCRVLTRKSPNPLTNSSRDDRLNNGLVGQYDVIRRNVS